MCKSCPWFKCCMHSEMVSWMGHESLALFVNQNKYFTCCLVWMWSCPLNLRGKYKLRLIFVPKREVKGRWRKLHSEEHHDLFSISNAKSVIKSRLMISMGIIVCIGEMRIHTELWLENCIERYHFRQTCKGRMITLKCILKNQDVITAFHLGKI